LVGSGESPFHGVSRNATGRTARARIMLLGVGLGWHAKSRLGDTASTARTAWACVPRRAVLPPQKRSDEAVSRDPVEGSACPEGSGSGKTQIERRYVRGACTLANFTGLRNERRRFGVHVCCVGSSRFCCWPPGRCALAKRSCSHRCWPGCRTPLRSGVDSGLKKRRRADTQVRLIMSASPGCCGLCCARSPGAKRREGWRQRGWTGHPAPCMAALQCGRPWDIGRREGPRGPDMVSAGAAPARDTPGDRSLNRLAADSKRIRHRGRPKQQLPAASVKAVLARRRTRSYRGHARCCPPVGGGGGGWRRRPPQRCRSASRRVSLTPARAHGPIDHRQSPTGSAGSRHVGGVVADRVVIAGKGMPSGTNAVRAFQFRGADRKPIPTRGPGESQGAQKPRRCCCCSRRQQQCAAPGPLGQSLARAANGTRPTPPVRGDGSVSGGTSSSVRRDRRGRFWPEAASGAGPRRARDRRVHHLRGTGELIAARAAVSGLGPFFLHGECTRCDETAGWPGFRPPAFEALARIEIRAATCEGSRR